MQNRYTKLTCEECQEIFMVENNVSEKLIYWGGSYYCPECDAFDEILIDTPEEDDLFLTEFRS